MRRQIKFYFEMLLEREAKNLLRNEGQRTAAGNLFAFGVRCVWKWDVKGRVVIGLPEWPTSDVCRTKYKSGGPEGCPSNSNQRTVAVAKRGLKKSWSCGLLSPLLALALPSPGPRRTNRSTLPSGPPRPSKTATASVTRTLIPPREGSSATATRESASPFAPGLCLELKLPLPLLLGPTLPAPTSVTFRVAPSPPVATSRRLRRGPTASAPGANFILMRPVPRLPEISASGAPGDRGVPTLGTATGRLASEDRLAGPASEDRLAGPASGVQAEAIPEEFPAASDPRIPSPTFSASALPEPPRATPAKAKALWLEANVHFFLSVFLSS